MTNGKLIGGVGLLTVLCCAGPPLLVILGSLGVTAWFANVGFVLIPIVFVAVGIAVFYLYRRRHSGSAADSACCGLPQITRKN